MVTLYEPRVFSSLSLSFFLLVCVRVRGASVFTSFSLLPSAWKPDSRQVPMTPPTLAMSFGANDGPLGGRSGGVFVNASQVKARLLKEVENNVTLLMRQNLTDTDQLEVTRVKVKKGFDAHTQSSKFVVVITQKKHASRRTRQKERHALLGAFFFVAVG